MLEHRPAPICFSFVNSGSLLDALFVSPVSPSTEERLHDGGDSACGPLVVVFWVVVVVLVFFSTIRLFFPPFNDDLGTMPTRRPYWGQGTWELGTGKWNWGQGTGGRELGTTLHRRERVLLLAQVEPWAGGGGMLDARVGTLKWAEN